MAEVLVKCESAEMADEIRSLLRRAGYRNVQVVDHKPAVHRMAAVSEYPSEEPPELAELRGGSAAMVKVRHQLAQVARLDSSVLITGETGTGKELAARAIHRLSCRADRPFVAVNVAAIPETLMESELFGYAAGAFTGARREGHKGRFLQAQGGTLFLDEVGDLDLSMQTKLLRVLQERQVDVIGSASAQAVDLRIIAATHRPLEELVAAGKFRADLFYRLNVVRIHLPPLRERHDDVEVLAEHFLRQLAQRYGRRVTLSPEAMGALGKHRWEGNVRELANAVECAYSMCDGSVIFREHLPPTVLLYDLVEPRGDQGHRFSAQLLLETLQQTGGNKSEACRRLGISRSGLYLRLKELAPTGDHPR